MSRGANRASAALRTTTDAAVGTTTLLAVLFATLYTSAGYQSMPGGRLGAHKRRSRQHVVDVVPTVFAPAWGTFCRIGLGCHRWICINPPLGPTLSSLRGVCAARCTYPGVIFPWTSWFWKGFFSDHARWMLRQTLCHPFNQAGVQAATY